MIKTVERLDISGIDSTIATSHKPQAHVTVLVVTFNRRILLMRCLAAIAGQTRPPERILIVDNASTDGTRDFLQSEGWLQRQNVELLALDDNTGGAGGFSAGLKHAVENGADWVWMMDDDAEPQPDALEKLTDRSLTPENLYGSVAVFCDRLSWPMMPHNGKSKDSIAYVHAFEKLPYELDVQFIPFLGILVNTALVKRIGLPDAGFFLAADDVDYCMRAREAGAKILLVGASRITHPASERYRLQLPGRPFYLLKLAPWKRYYDVRNRIFVARRHYGAALWYKTIPSSFLRLMVTLWHEDKRYQQIKAFCAGMIDGLWERKGKRHEKWGIRP
jgi:GT2 family glycosyltransferase